MTYNNRAARARALAGGQLVDVSEVAASAGLTAPVAATARLWADIVAVPPQYRGEEDALSRLWDVLWRARWAALSSEPQVVYEVVLHVGEQELYQVKLVNGADERGAPHITLMRADEA
jgi:hypothetical protein